MNTLRDWIAEEKQWYSKKYGGIDWHWTSEGSAWAIQDYCSSIGSLLDFTEDDFAAAAEEGWRRDEVRRLCEEDDE